MPFDLHLTFSAEVVQKHVSLLATQRSTKDRHLLKSTVAGRERIKHPIWSNTGVPKHSQLKGSEISPYMPKSYSY